MRHRLKNGRAVRSRCAERSRIGRRFRRARSDAIAQVIADAQPEIRDVEEFHDALLQWVLMEVSAKSRTWPSSEWENAPGCSPRPRDTSPTPLSGCPGWPAVFSRGGVGIKPLQATARSNARWRCARWCRVGLKWWARPRRLSSRETVVPEAEVEQALYKMESVGQVFRGGFGLLSTGVEVVAIAGCSNAFIGRRWGGCVGKSSRSHRQT